MSTPHFRNTTFVFFLTYQVLSTFIKYVILQSCLISNKICGNNAVPPHLYDSHMIWTSELNPNLETLKSDMQIWHGSNYWNESKQEPKLTGYVYMHQNVSDRFVI